MALNPALHDEVVTSPIERANPLNDPQDVSQQGYNTFDLTNQKVATPRFGEYTPFDVFEVVPADRHVVHDATLTLLNSVDANMVSRVNEYHDYFYVPMRSCFPVNYERMIVNPTKGSDLPLDALPMIPIMSLFHQLLYGADLIEFSGFGPVPAGSLQGYNIDTDLLFDEEEPTSDTNLYNTPVNTVLVNNILYLAYYLSRGQLLDYLGFALDYPSPSDARSYGLGVYDNPFQHAIETLFRSLPYRYDVGSAVGIYGYDLSIMSSDDGVLINQDTRSYQKVIYTPAAEDWSLTAFRAALYDCFEKGLFIQFVSLSDYLHTGDLYMERDFVSAAHYLMRFFTDWVYSKPDSETSVDEFFNPQFINPMRMIAYQQIIAEYGSNDSIDNIFTSELWMENMKSIMFGIDGSSSLPIPSFSYNGVKYEYDLFTSGAIEAAFLQGTSSSRVLVRLLPFLSNLLGLRRSLRYGDYFSTGRPDFLSVGQLGISVDTDSSMVSPIEVTQELLRARYLQATNWMGSKFEAQMKGVHQSTPSDTGPHPYFISHRKIELSRDIVSNTADNQGKQVTNLVGQSDNQGIDIYVDDFGVVLGLVSYDVLPLYPAGIDRNFRNYDRFSMFNPMLQNVGDQEIRIDELTGEIYPEFGSQAFAYTTRYAQYKFMTSRAHGGFVGKLPGYAMLYPLAAMMNDSQRSTQINPEYIRDKPFYFDQFYASSENVDPCGYFHFVYSVNNEHAAARRMQLIPQLLF